MKVMFLFRSAGNHSNRLFQAIHFEAFCKEHNIKYRNLVFNDMSPLYGLHSSVYNKFMLRILNFFKAHKFGNHFIDFDTEESNKEKSSLLINNKMLWGGVYGWYFRCHELTEKYHDYFAKKYTLSDKYISKSDFAKNILNMKRDKKCTLVGVHIRRGDYKEWQDGKYYFEDSTFLSYIDKMKLLCKDKNETVKFILFSNEPLTIGEAEDFILSPKDTPWYIDQYLMSQCDYLIGPPSTFTMWASYINKVPLLQMQSKDSPDFCFENFNIING